jgi:hypothetical protein
MINLDNLTKLNEMNKAADEDIHKAEICGSAEKNLKKLRVSDRNAVEIINLLLDGWRYGSDKKAKEVFFEVINEHKNELLRLAELRLNSESRTIKSKAMMVKAQIKCSIIDIEVD